MALARTLRWTSCLAALSVLGGVGGLRADKTYVLNWCDGQLNVSNSLADTAEGRGIAPVSELFRRLKRVRFTNHCPVESSPSTPANATRPTAKTYDVSISHLQGLKAEAS